MNLVVYRIGRSGPLRCIAGRRLNDTIEVRASTFSRNWIRVPIADVFLDREACRAEIQRRANGTKETNDGR
jgi:hypothetical protein